MTPLEKKKIQHEMIKMDANIMDAEIRIEERLAEIERIKGSIETYNDKKKELEEKLGDIHE